MKNSRDQPLQNLDLIDLRCPNCNKKLAFLSKEDIDLKYLQLKCSRCKIEFYYSKGEIKQIPLEQEPDYLPYRITHGAHPALSSR